MLAAGAGGFVLKDSPAASLQTNERTVKSQVSSVLQKLGARDRAAAIMVAYEAGWRRP